LQLIGTGARFYKRDLMDARFIHLLMAQILTALVGVYPYFVRRTKIAFYFAGAHITLALWCLNECIVYLPADHAVRLTLFRISYIVGIVMVWCFFHFLLGMAEIPVSRLRGNWRVIQASGILCIILTFTPWLTTNIDEYAHPFKEIPGPIYPLFIAFMLWGLGLPLYHLGRAYKSTHGHARTQLKYLFIASCFAFLEGLIFFASLYIPRINYYYFYLQVFYSALLAYAIVAHHLMDITVIRKTLEYSLVTAVLMGVYFSVVTTGAYLIGRWTPFPASYSSALAAFIIAYLFHPLRMRVQLWIDKKFFRQQVAKGQALSAFSDHLTGHMGINELAKALQEVLDAALQLKVIGLYLRNQSDQVYDRCSTSPSTVLPPQISIESPWVTAALAIGAQAPVLPDVAKAWGIVKVFPMNGSSGLVGLLMIGEKLSEVSLTGDDERLIRSVLEQATMAYEQITLFIGRSDAGNLELLADVASGFVHEIKTPIANINLPAQATMRDLNALENGTNSLELLLPKFKERMKFIMTQAFKAGERIDAIRQFAAIEDTRVEAVDLSHVLNESISSLEPQLEKSSVRVHYEVPAGLPLIRANAKQLEIVFVNLIKNAVEAMSETGIREQNRHLWLTIARDGAFHVVHVKDSGPGIKPDDLNHVFDQFFTTKGKSGTGVGLHLTKQLTEAMGGSICASSELGQGATFSVKLPSMNSQNPKAFRNT